MKKILGAATLMLASAASPEQDPQLPGWLAGCWEQRDGERWTEECWTSPRGGMMLGGSRSGRGDELLEWEVLRIERNGAYGDGAGVKLAYLASPGGRGWTVFAWSPAEEEGLSFFNLANDYPQRIRYWREGDDLLAEIALADGSKPRRWHYVRKKPG